MGLAVGYRILPRTVHAAWELDAQDPDDEECGPDDFKRTVARKVKQAIGLCEDVEKRATQTIALWASASADKASNAFQHTDTLRNSLFDAIDDSGSSLANTFCCNNAK